MLQLLKNHLKKRAAEIAAAHNVDEKNVKICWTNGVFTYQIFRDGLVIMEREFNL